jgi:hypothetical protein
MEGLNEGILTVNRETTDDEDFSKMLRIARMIGMAEDGKYRNIKASDVGSIEITKGYTTRVRILGKGPSYCRNIDELFEKHAGQGYSMGEDYAPYGQGYIPGACCMAII